MKNRDQKQSTPKRDSEGQFVSKDQSSRQSGHQSSYSDSSKSW